MLISPNNHQSNIDSPLTIFNNVINNITQELEKILYSKLDKKDLLLAKQNNIIFNEKSIYLINFIKVYNKNDELHLTITKKSLDINDLTIINNIHNNWDKINKIFFHYLLMYNSIANNYDAIPEKFIDNINNLLITNKLNESDFFLIPFKNKVSKLYDKNKSYHDKLYDRYNYIIKFTNNKQTFNYKIYCVLSNEINETIGLECLRFLDSEIISEGTYKLRDSKEFLNKLFQYGEILKL